MLTNHIIKCDPSDGQSVDQVVNYYVGYLDNSHDPVGIWQGKGAKALGLSGEVTAEQLRNVLLGKSPSGHKELVKVRVPRPEDNELVPVKTIDGKEKKKCKKPAYHVPGIDFTFSVPKDVSVWWSLETPENRAIIEKCVFDALMSMMTYIEANIPTARRGKNGKEEVLANLVMAVFRHATARNNFDVQLHWHILLVNLCRGLDDEKWAKINTRTLLKLTRTLGPLLRNSALTNLVDAFGVEAYLRNVGDDVKDGFSLRGVNADLSDRFSSRRKEILAESELLSGKCSTTKARQYANLLTRKSKVEQPSVEELDRKWLQTALEFGQTQESLELIKGRNPHIDIDARFERAVQKAAEICTKDQAFFTRLKFIQRVSEQLQDVPISGLDVLQRAEQALKRDQFKELIDADLKEPIYTTNQMWELEKETLRLVDEIRSRDGPLIALETIGQVLGSKRHRHLLPEQKEAVRTLVSSNSAFKCLTGLAGSGKTSVLKAVTEILELAGYTVVGSAVAGAAKEELSSKAGIKSRTLEGYRKQLTLPPWKQKRAAVMHFIRMFCRAVLGKSTWKRATIDNKTVLILDEASMCDTSHWKLLLETAEKSGMKMIAVGDGMQLNPVGPGGMFRRIERSVPTANLSTNLRQRAAPEDAKAADMLREGKVEEMLKSYATRGRLTVSKTRDEAAGQLATQWAEDGGLDNPEKAIVLTQTREEARQLNRLCQSHRYLAGKLSGPSTSYRGIDFYVKDRVMFHKGNFKHGIENGYQGTVVGIDPNTREITIKLDRAPSEQQRRWGRKQLVKMKASEFEATEATLGYAATTHKMQGQTCERAYALIGGAMTNLQLIYVQITRAKLLTKLFTDRNHAGDELADLVASIKQSGAKKLAHDHGLRLEIERSDEEKK